MKQLWFFLFIIFLIVGCNGSKSQAPIHVQNKKKPEIVSFTTDKTEITAGESITLNWVTKNADTITLFPMGINDLSSSGQYLVEKVEETTTFVLEARNSLGSVTQEITITVSSHLFEYPKVISFRASKTTIACGETVTLSWQTQAEQIEVLPAGMCDNQQITGACTVVPHQSSTTFILIAKRGGKQDVKEILVNMEPAKPILFDFGFAQNPVTGYQNVDLSYLVQCADTVIITSPESASSVYAGTKLQNTVTINAKTSADYTLKAISPKGEISKTIHLKILPKIIDFTAAPTALKSGESSNLSWQTQGASEIFISEMVNHITAFLDVPSDKTGENEASVFPVKPQSTAVYQLTATNSDGDVAKRELTITVTPYPSIIEFSAKTSQVLLGNSTSLIWKAGGSTAEIRIIDQAGNELIQSQKLSGEISITPASTTTYTLTASDAQAEVTQITTVQVLETSEVIHFTASPDTLASGDSSVLSWQVSPGSDIEILDSSFQVIHTSHLYDGQFVVSPLKTTSYTLRAFNSLSEDFDTVVVLVDPVEIHTFEASPEVLIKGETATITWSVSNSADVSISPVLMPMTVQSTSFEFTDILGSGIDKTSEMNDGDEEFTTAINLGFPFLFYGKYYEKLLISDNGFVTFLETTPTTSFINHDIPDSRIPNAYAACFWDDLRTNIDGSSKLLVKSIGSSPYKKFIIQWDHFDFFSSSVDGDLTFQMVLSENGKIQCNYKKMTGTTSDGKNWSDGMLATIGVESEDGQTGTKWIYNGLDTLGNARKITASSSIQFLLPSLSPSGEMYVSPQETTTYTLLAQDVNGFHQTKQITIFIIPKNSVIINEFYADMDQSGFDWVELYNDSDDPVDLNGWIISDYGSDSHQIQSPQGLILSPKSFLVLASSNNIPGVSADYVYSQFKLSPNSDSIIVSLNQNTIDEISYDFSQQWDFTLHHSNMLRRNISQDDNDQSFLWCVSNTSITSTNMYGTPHNTNGSCIAGGGDQCHEAIPITLNYSSLYGGYVASTQGSNDMAANDINLLDIQCSSDPSFSGQGSDIWYRIDLPSDVDYFEAQVTSDISHPFSNHLYLLSGSCNALQKTACSQAISRNSYFDSQFIVSSVLPKGTYYLVVDAPELSQFGTYHLDIKTTGDKIVGYQVSYQSIVAKYAVFPDISFDATTLEAQGIATDDSKSFLFQNISPGFAFSFFDEQKTVISANVNGNMSLANTTDGVGISWLNKDIPYASVPNDLLSVYWDDLGLKTVNGIITSKIFYKVENTSPNRLYIIQWNDLDYSKYSTPKGNFTFQARLYEDTGIIEFLYKTMEITNDTVQDLATCGSATVGLENSTGTQGVKICYNTPGNIYDDLLIEFTPY